MPGVKNAILISLDCLRADHLPLYGYERDTAPFLSELAARSLVFTRAYATSNFTAPTHASMFSGLYPHQHGFIDFMCRIREDMPTIAERLAQNGIKTAALTSWYCFSEKSGMMRGFQDCRVVPGQNLKEKALVQVEQTKEWLAANKSDPFFLYVHFGQIHAPFNLCPGQTDEPLTEPTGSPMKAIWEVPPPGGPIFMTLQWLENRLDRWSRTGRILYRLLKMVRQRWFLGSIHNVVERVRSGKVEPTEEERLFVAQRYDQCIRYVDERLRDLFATLGSLALDRETAVIIVGDHGEELFDHGQLFHGHSLHQELVHVPMILSLPESMKPFPGTCDVQVDQRDIAATFLDVLGLGPDRVDPVGEGISMLEIARDPERWLDRPSFFEAVFNREWLSAGMVRGDGKVQWMKPGDRIVYFPVDENLDTPPEGVEPPDDARELVAALREFVDEAFRGKAPDAGSDDDMTPELRKQLEELGYM